MPTAVFYGVEGLAPHEAPRRLYGRAAVAAYVEGSEGRLMRSMKSILGSSLVEQTHRPRRRPLDHVRGSRGRLPAPPQATGASASGHADHAGRAGSPGVLRRRRPRARRQGPGCVGSRGARGRLRRGAVPVRADRRRARLRAAHDASRSCWWPTSVAARRTSPWSVSGPSGACAASVATTSWPTTACTPQAPTSTATSSWPASCRSAATRAWVRAGGAAPREVPSGVYFDLATWHLINTVYIPQRVAEVASMRDFYGDARQHERLMAVVTQRLGHALAARPSRARSTVADGDAGLSRSMRIEPGLAAAGRSAGGGARSARISNASSPPRARRCAWRAAPTRWTRCISPAARPAGAAGATPGGGVARLHDGARRPVRQRGAGPGPAGAAAVCADRARVTQNGPWVPALAPPSIRSTPRCSPTCLLPCAAPSRAWYWH